MAAAPAKPSTRYAHRFHSVNVFTPWRTGPAIACHDATGPISPIVRYHRKNRRRPLFRKGRGRFESHRWGLELMAGRRGTTVSDSSTGGRRVDPAQSDSRAGLGYLVETRH